MKNECDSQLQIDTDMRQSVLLYQIIKVTISTSLLWEAQINTLTGTLCLSGPSTMLVCLAVVQWIKFTNTNTNANTITNTNTKSKACLPHQQCLRSCVLVVCLLAVQWHSHTLGPSLAGSWHPQTDIMKPVWHLNTGAMSVWHLIMTTRL